MEHKIKVLVQSVAQATTSLANTLPNTSSHPANVATSQALAKDVAALQRLVNASIAALRNAAAATPGSGSSSSNTSVASSASSVSSRPSMTSSTNIGQPSSSGMFGNGTMPPNLNRSSMDLANGGNTLGNNLPSQAAYSYNPGPGANAMRSSTNPSTIPPSEYRNFSNPQQQYRNPPNNSFNYPGPPNRDY
jgi:hypothetical protein